MDILFRKSKDSSKNTTARIICFVPYIIIIELEEKIREETFRLKRVKEKKTTRKKHDELLKEMELPLLIDYNMPPHRRGKPISSKRNIKTMSFSDSVRSPFSKGDIKLSGNGKSTKKKDQLLTFKIAISHNEIQPSTKIFDETKNNTDFSSKETKQELPNEIKKPLLDDEELVTPKKGKISPIKKLEHTLGKDIMPLKNVERSSNQRQKLPVKGQQPIRDDQQPQTDKEPTKNGKTPPKNQRTTPKQSRQSTQNGTSKLPPKLQPTVHKPRQLSINDDHQTPHSGNHLTHMGRQSTSKGQPSPHKGQQPPKDDEPDNLMRHPTISHLEIPLKAGTDRTNPKTEDASTRAGAFFRKLGRILSVSARRNKLIVWKPSEEDDDIDAYIVPKAPYNPKRQMRRKYDQRGETFETGEYFETQQDERKVQRKPVIVYSSSGSDYQAAQYSRARDSDSSTKLPTKQDADRHIDTEEDEKVPRTFSGKIRLAMKRKNR